ncbi:MAG: hypothetical protein ACYCU0_06280 [Solirubrobacteraceae bacterium]
MSGTATTTVEIETALLVRLRERSPGLSDRALIESLASIALGREAIHQVRERFADRDPREIEAEAVKAARQARHELAAERAGAGRAGA